jgi:hypothetical protein
MQGQTFPFNGDGYAASEVLRLKAKHNLTTAIETGTCLGVTTSWFAQNFDRVMTCEVSPVFYGYAQKVLCNYGNVFASLSTSPEFIERNKCSALYFLDAHGISGKGEDTCPLLDELKAIGVDGRRSVIMIHDWQVPGRPDLGHDLFPDRTPFALPAIAPYLDAIYGIDGWNHHYNHKAEGAKRGIIYIEPK